jgi:ABC-type tungstate transport system substrate-binding protein
MKDIWSGIAAAFILIVIAIEVNLVMHWLSRTEKRGRW